MKMIQNHLYDHPTHQALSAIDTFFKEVKSATPEKLGGGGAGVL
jgi:hypothetical protein